MLKSVDHGGAELEHVSNKNLCANSFMSQTLPRLIAASSQPSSVKSSFNDNDSTLSNTPTNTVLDQSKPIPKLEAIFYLVRLDKILQLDGILTVKSNN